MFAALNNRTSYGGGLGAQTPVLVGCPSGTKRAQGGKRRSRQNGGASGAIQSKVGGREDVGNRGGGRNQ